MTGKAHSDQKKQQLGEAVATSLFKHIGDSRHVSPRYRGLSIWYGTFPPVYASYANHFLPNLEEWFDPNTSELSYFVLYLHFIVLIDIFENATLHVEEWEAPVPPHRLLRCQSATDHLSLRRRRCDVLLHCAPQLQEVFSPVDVLHCEL